MILEANTMNPRFILATTALAAVLSLVLVPAIPAFAAKPGFGQEGSRQKEKRI